MSGRKEILHVLSVTTLASFLTGINARILVVGIPELAHSLGADVEQVIWLTQAYMLGSTAVQLIVGSLSDIYGRVNLFSMGFALFSLSSLFCGFSSNVFQLISLRLFQGIGAAFLISLSLAIITDSVPKDQLGTWIGVNQIAFRLGSLIGLTLGGLIIDNLGWRWVFWVHVPLGLISVFWSRMRLKEVYRPVKARVDYLGFLSFTSAVSLILLSLTLAAYGSAYLGASLILASLGSLIIFLFIYWELKSPSPALDLRIFREWQFTGGIVAQFLYSLAFGSVTVLLVIYLSVVKGLSASSTGMLLLPFELAFLIFGTLGGKLSDNYGYAPITLLGLALSSTSLYMMSLFSTQTSTRFILSTMSLLGCGAGLFVTPNASSIMIGAPQERRGVASSIRTLSFNVGFAASLNLSVLLMTGFIPYDLASRLIAAELIDPADLGNVNLLSRALSETFKFQSIVMASAMLFSVSRLPLKIRAIRPSEKGSLERFEVKDSSRASIFH